MPDVRPGEKILANDINNLFLHDSDRKTLKVGRGLKVKNFPGGYFLDLADQSQTIAPGQYQGMQLTTTCQLKVGWQFPMAVSMS